MGATFCYEIRPVFHPTGQLKLFKFIPDKFVVRSFWPLFQKRVKEWTKTGGDFKPRGIRHTNKPNVIRSDENKLKDPKPNFTRVLNILIKENKVIRSSTYKKEWARVI